MFGRFVRYLKKPGMPKWVNTLRDMADDLQDRKDRKSLVGVPDCRHKRLRKRRRK